SPEQQESNLKRRGRQRDTTRCPVLAAGRPDVARLVAVLVVLIALAIVTIPPARAAPTTYKWVDDKGVVHYTDKIPPEAINKANVQLDKQGVPIKRTEPAPTLEQRKAKADEEAQRQQ